jgi:hypothetical protein
MLHRRECGGIMRIHSIILTVAILFAATTAGNAAIDKLQKQDARNLAVGMLQLYYNIGKSCIEFTKDTVLALPNLPKGIAVDIFHIGGEEAPSAYYMTAKEKREREQGKRLEKAMEKEEKKALKLEDKDGFTKIR